MPDNKIIRQRDQVTSVEPAANNIAKIVIVMVIVIVIVIVIVNKQSHRAPRVSHIDVRNAAVPRGPTRQPPMTR